MPSTAFKMVVEVTDAGTPREKFACTIWQGEIGRGVWKYKGFGSKIGEAAEMAWNSYKGHVDPKCGQRQDPRS
jgi:hypothetical protein